MMILNLIHNIAHDIISFILYSSIKPFEKCYFFSILRFRFFVFCIVFPFSFICTCILIVFFLLAFKCLYFYISISFFQRKGGVIIFRVFSTF